MERFFIIQVIILVKDGVNALEVQAKDYSQKSDSMELIISLLLQYPQVNKVNIDLNLRELTFTFLIQRKLSIPELEEFKLKLNQSLRLYDSLSPIAVSEIETAYRSCGDLTELEITAGLSNLSKEVISFLIRFVYNEFGINLLSEDIGGTAEDISITKNTFIDDLLENLEVNNLNHILIGFRDDNKVLVFSKANN